MSEFEDVDQVNDLFMIGNSIEIEDLDSGGNTDPSASSAAKLNESDDFILQQEKSVTHSEPIVKDIEIDVVEENFASEIEVIKTEVEILEKRKSIRRIDDMDDVIDPSFPSEVVNDQEEFIYSMPANSLNENDDGEIMKPVPSATKLELYGRRVFKLAVLLARKSKTVLRKDGEVEQLFRYQIHCVKKRIKQVTALIIAENASDTQFPSLESGQNEDDLIDVEPIVCSKCGQTDAPDNDILLCDRQHCCRAYHQNCLDPIVDPSLIVDNPYWFCWTCDTINNCLTWINNKTGRNFNTIEELFPEVEADEHRWIGKFTPETDYDPEIPTVIPPPKGLRKKRPKGNTNYLSLVIFVLTWYSLYAYIYMFVLDESEESDVSDIQEVDIDYKRKRKGIKENRPKPSHLLISGYAVFARENMSLLQREVYALHMAPTFETTDSLCMY
jgi:hypothetical protein